MDKARLLQILDELPGRRVHVIGDAIRDVYTQAKCLGAASKSPTLVYERGTSQEWVGGAGVIGHHCAAAGASVTTITRANTVKERILVEGVKVAEFHTAPNPKLGKITSLLGPWVTGPPEIVIFADFGHGVFDRQTTREILDAVPPGVLTAADCQATDIAWGNIGAFKGCDFLFANERELRFATRDQHSPIESLVDWRWATRAFFLKLGAQGLLVRDATHDLRVPAYANQPIVDPIGAGDAMLAYATLAYHASKDLEAAAILGSLAAAEACAHQGNVVVTPAAIRARL